MYKDEFINILAAISLFLIKVVFIYFISKFSPLISSIISFLIVRYFFRRSNPEVTEILNQKSKVLWFIVIALPIIYIFLHIAQWYFFWAWNTWIDIDVYSKYSIILLFFFLWGAILIQLGSSQFNFKGRLFFTVLFLMIFWILNFTISWLIFGLLLGQLLH